MGTIVAIALEDGMSLQFRKIDTKLTLSLFFLNGDCHQEIRVGSDKLVLEMVLGG